MLRSIMVVKCPFCEIEQKQKPSKTWAYGTMIKARTEKGIEWGASVKCSQYNCECGKPFRFYLTTKGKYWTIPKSKDPTK